MLERQTAIKPPVLDGPWPAGGIKYFAEDKLKFITEQVPKYAGLFEVKSFFFGKIGGDFDRMYIVSEPDYVQHILQKNNRNYIKGHAYEELKHLLGNGLLTSEGDFWRKQRRLIQPAFHRERLTGFAKIMIEECQVVMGKWRVLPNGSTINLSKAMMEMTLQIVCKAMFSSDVAHLVEEVNREFNYANEKLIQRTTNPFSLPLSIPTPGNLKEKNSYENIRKMVDGIIEKRRQSSEKYQDLLAMLMEARDEQTGEGMSDEQLRDEVVTIFLAGHETTGVALTWLFHCLDENNEVEEQLLEEFNNVLDENLPGIQHLRKLTYTRMVIDETLRLYPPVWLLGRQSLEDDMLGDYIIPKNTNCLIPVYSIHRDKRYWNEPLKFMPERFEPERSKSRHKFAYFPFGGGPRLCVGNNFALMEMQLALPMILREFTLHKPKNFTFKKDPLITMRPHPEMQMVIERRTK